MWFFDSLIFCHSLNCAKSLWLQRNLESLLYQVLSICGFERCGGHDALDHICLKWLKFRFQILLRQNIANYVYVTIHVLKCAYLHLISLKTRKRDFLLSEFVLFSESWKMSLTSKESRKLVYRVFSSRSSKPSRGHDAPDLIRLKWQKFRFQILLRQNVEKYVYVTIHVLKCAYLYLISLKARKCGFTILWTCVILWIVKKVSEISKAWRIMCYQKAAATNDKNFDIKVYCGKISQITDM